MRSLWDFFIQSYSVLFFKFSRIASLFDMPILGKPPKTGSTAVSATIIPMRLRLLFRLQRSLLHLNSVGSYCPENGIHNFSYPLQSVHQLKYLFRSAMPSNLPDRLPAVVPMYIGICHQIQSQIMHLFPQFCQCCRLTKRLSTAECNTVQ